MATSNLLTFTSYRYKLPPPASCAMSSAFRACKACVNVLSWLHFKNVHLETSRNSEKAFLAPSLLQKDPCYDKSEFFWCGLSQWAFSELLPWNYGWDILKQQSCDSTWLATSRNGCLLLAFFFSAILSSVGSTIASVDSILRYLKDKAYSRFCDLHHLVCQPFDIRLLLLTYANLQK